MFGERKYTERAVVKDVELVPRHEEPVNLIGSGNSELFDNSPFQRVVIDDSYRITLTTNSGKTVIRDYYDKPGFIKDFNRGDMVNVELKHDWFSWINGGDEVVKISKLE